MCRFWILTIYIIHERLSAQVGFLDSHPEFDAIYGDDELIDKKGTIFSTENMQRHSGNIYEKLLIDNFVSHNNIMVKRKHFDEMGMFNEDVKVADDYEVWLRFSTKYKFYYVPVYFVKYRIMKDQISSNKDRRFDSNEKTIRKSIEDNPGLINDSKRKYILCRFYTRRGAYKASIGNIKAAIADYMCALRYETLCKYPWRAIARAILLQR